MRILYEDNHVIAVFKPPGVLTQPSPQEEESLEKEVKAFIKERDNKPGAVFLHAIHRLDRPVSGIVVFAKTSKALSRLQASIRAKKEKKRYIAEVEGKLKETSGSFVDQLLHGDGVAEVAPSHPQAKRAELHFRLLEEKEKTSLVEVELITGRYHQIRVQFASRGHPILGDRKYGSALPYSREGIALSHVFFSIPHPIQGSLEVAV